MERRKSYDSLTSQSNVPEMEQSSSRRKSHESDAGDVQRRKSVELMEIDDIIRGESFDSSFDNNNQRESVATGVHILSSHRPSQPLVNKSVAKTYLTKEEFDYSMNLLDTKITSIYKLCRYIGDKQNDHSKALKRLVVLDEISEEFWSVSNLAYLAVLF